MIQLMMNGDNDDDDGGHDSMIQLMMMMMVMMIMMMSRDFELSRNMNDERTTETLGNRKLEFILVYWIKELKSKLNRV